MIERTEIDMQNLHFTYMELVSCRVYDDAKLLLNKLVKKEVGREYGDSYYLDKETDEWLCREIKYKNSETPSVVKLAIIDAMVGFLNNRDLISEEGTIAFEKSKVKDTAIIPFKKMDNDVARVRGWVLRWQKEPAIKIDNEKFRFRPKSVSVRETAGKMFKYLVSIGRLESRAKGSWDYFCGMSDNEDEAIPMVWHKGLPSLCALVEVFFCNEIYFSYKKGIVKDFVCKMFVQENGLPITETSFKSSKTQSKTNGGLEREMQLYCDNVGIFMPKEKSKHEKLD